MNLIKHKIGETSSANHLWLSMLRRYLGIVIVANLAWEVLHLPLYTLWEVATLAELAFTVVHCTAGDLLISLSALSITLILVGNHHWPRDGFYRVMVVTSVIGLAYTIYSERLNTLVRESWAYSEWMLVIPILDVGISPVAQWLIIPPLAFWWSRQSLQTQNASVKNA